MIENSSKTPSQEYRDEQAFIEALDHAKPYLLGWDIDPKMPEIGTDTEYQLSQDEPQK